MIKRGYNPQQLMMNFLEQNMKGTPIGDNILNLARNGQTREIEKIARNMMAQRGVDFDKEFNAFRQSLGI
jgi:hypothetical protein